MKDGEIVKFEERDKERTWENNLQISLLSFSYFLPALCDVFWRRSYCLC